MVSRIILVFIWCLIGAGCSETEWSEKQVGSSGVFISFPQEVTFHESFQPLGDSEDSFYSKLNGSIDEDTSYSISILQLTEVKEEEIVELIKEEHLNQNCGSDIPSELGIDMSFMSKEITETAGKQSFLTKCAINNNGVNGLAEIYLIANKNQLITLSTTYPLNGPSIQSNKFVSSLEFAQ